MLELLNGMEREALEVIVDEQSVLLAAADVDQLVEYEVAPLPLSHRLVAGLGVLRDEVIVSIWLGAVPRTGRRVTKGALITPLVTPLVTSGLRLRWSIEVTRTVGLVRATLAERNFGGPGYFVDATCSGRPELGSRWVDTERLLAALGVAHTLQSAQKASLSELRR